MKKTIITIAGTRPELIRLSVIISKLDELVNHILIYTNQNFTYNLSDIFFKELGIRKPDYVFETQSNLSSFLGNAFIEFEKILDIEAPTSILILGDTNTGLLALIANKRAIPVIHMEAGSRCFSKLVPEETNRQVIDILSTYNLPYTENSKQNLLAEGFHKNFVFKIGNPIYEVILNYSDKIKASNILKTLKVKEKEFVLVTAHRAENVDTRESLSGIITALNIIATEYKIIFSVHPRTKDKISKFGLSLGPNITMSEPFGLFDFIKLEQNAKVVISDSGTCQEEACLFNVPSITIRESTERQETVECGSNILVGTDTEQIVNVFNVLKDRMYSWQPPEDYMKENVSDTVINILLGKV